MSLNISFLSILIPRSFTLLLPQILYSPIWRLSNDIYQCFISCSFFSNQIIADSEIFFHFSKTAYKSTSQTCAVVSSAKLQVLILCNKKNKSFR